MNDDGTATVGMTDVAQNLAGPLLHAKPKKVGVVRKKGKPVGTVESSKWVGPVKSPLSGEIVAVNETLASDAQVINRSPYKDGWIVKLRPSQLDEELATLLTGQPAVDAYRERIETEDLKACEHVEGFEA
jgi:glycine cleavage system H protein